VKCEKTIAAAQIQNTIAGGDRDTPENTSFPHERVGSLPPEIILINVVIEVLWIVATPFKSKLNGVTPVYHASEEPIQRFDEW